MIVLILIVLGLCLGSFTNALVWRLHEAEGKKKPSKKMSITHGRSMCVHCGHELAAKDLVPVLSWLELRGRCRYCAKPISRQYPLVEVLTTALFVVSYLYWPLQLDGPGWLQFGLWLVITVMFVALSVYDLKWMILPNKLVYILIGISVCLVAINLIITPLGSVLVDALAGIACLAGLFYLLFQLSGGKWIGGGDVKLAVALGLIVGGPLNAVLLLFLASLGGSIVAIPLIIAGKAKRQTHVPFGPFLITATYIVFLFGSDITLWYERVFLGL
ncbi:prepilin peptidase [Candidatus Saccharibacteria bacterium]|nr:prepilin peptidase [Candidatus Saccharibacteria bacterium]